MSRSKKALTSEARALEKEIASLSKSLVELEAQIGQKQEKLLRLQRQLGEVPSDRKTGLEILWDAAPDKARERSSKFLCRKAWARIPKAERPPLKEAIAALKAWGQCDEWLKERGEFVPALDRWIGERRWECVPKTRNPLARYETPKTPRPAAPEGESLDPKAAAEFLANLDLTES